MEVQRAYQETLVSPAGGGALPDLALHQIPKDAWKVAQNVRIKNGRIYPRYGFTERPSGVLLGAVTLLAEHVSASASKTMLGGTPTQLAKWIGTAYSTGTASTETDSTRVTFADGTDLLTQDIFPGDTIQFVVSGQMTSSFIIQSIINSTTLDCTTPVPNNLSGVSFRITRTWRLLNKTYKVGEVSVEELSSAVMASGEADFSFLSNGDYFYAQSAIGGVYNIRRYIVKDVSVSQFTLSDEDGNEVVWPSGAGTGNVTYIIYKALHAGSNRWSYTEFIDPRRAVFANGTDSVFQWDSSWSEIRDVNGTAQISKLTPANVEVGDTFTATINGQAISFTATANTVANVTAGLTAAINSSGLPVTASDHTTHLLVEANAPGTPFQISASTTNASGGADTQTLTLALEQANAPGDSARFVETFANHLILAALSNALHAFKWSGYGNLDDFSFDVASYSGGGPLTDDTDEITGVIATDNYLYIFKENHYYIFAANQGRPAIIKAGYVRGVGCAAGHTPVAIMGSVVFLGRDGIYIARGAQFEREGDNRYFATFAEDFSWEDRHKAFSAYSPLSKEMMLFYVSKSNVAGQPNKALYMDVETRAVAFWDIEATSYAEVSESMSVTIDTIEDVFGPMTIDTMPWRTIDGIGADTGYVVQFIGSKDGKHHRFGSALTDNGESFDMQLLSGIMNLAGDISAQSIAVWGRILSEKTGASFPVAFRVYTYADINDSPRLRDNRDVVLNGEPVNIRLRSAGTWHQIQITAPVNGRAFSILGWSLEHTPIGRRKVSPFGIVPQVGSNANSNTPILGGGGIGGGGIGGGGIEFP